MTKALTATQVKNVTAYNKHLEGVVHSPVQSDRAHVVVPGEDPQARGDQATIHAKPYRNTVPTTPRGERPMEEKPQKPRA